MCRNLRRTLRPASCPRRTLHIDWIVGYRILGRTFCRMCFQSRTSSKASLSRQFVEQRLSVLQVGGVEALGEPAVNFHEHRAGLLTFALLV